MKFKHPLMQNNITKNDFEVVIKFLKKQPILTQNKRVEEFERLWSKWLGVKYSVFVNSGSSANFITLSALKKFTKKKEIITPTLTWPSDIMAVINNGFKPNFVDIDIETLSMNSNEIIKKINTKTAAVFITHAQGFNGLTTKLLNKLKKKKIILIEDVCESHGAKFKNKKLGTFGLASNFSFYYAHHLSTIEGGMICTNNKEFYDYCVRFRGHGMLRESKFSNIKKKSKNFKDLNKDFIFLNPGFNFRNNEIGAVLGINQLKKLDKNIKLRNINFKYFLKLLNPDKFITNYNLNGISNYAFPIILKSKSIKERDSFEKYLSKKGIEFRRGNAGGGNQLRQPYLKNFKNPVTFKNTEVVHNFGYYIGNFPSLGKIKVKKIANILNSYYS
ncbi:DegT/DnrJ/EryC1/StrS aminotransferase family protein [Candidatus Pelagibacter sp.]|nr:DegT/DnrJ/EryC1/StrS aminotransferase family protein [Candidatus Pelagibacter sp.]